MKPVRVAVAVQSLGLPLKRALRRTEEIGADGIQLELGRQITIADMTESARRQLLHELDELGLGIAALSVPVTRPVCEWEGLDARLEDIKQGMQLAFQLKAGVTTFRIGRIPHDDSSAQRETLLGVLNDLARHANHVGAFPSISTSGDSAEQIAGLLANVNQGPIGVNLDPATVILGGQSPPAFFRTLVEFVNHVTVRDAVRDLDGIVTEVPVGRGEVPWEELLSLVREAEFRHWLTVLRTQGDDASGDVQRAVKFVRTVLTE